MVGKLLFTANDGVHGEEIWVTDGTASGTYALGAIKPDQDFQADNFTVFSNGEALFPGTGATGGSELWATDGSAAGTAVFAGIPSSAHANPAGAVIWPSVRLGNGDVVFEDTPLASTGSAELLWTTNGTPAGTSQIAQFANNPALFGGPALVTLDNGEAMFNAFDAVDGTELWITDGSAGGTILLSDLNPGSGPTILTSYRVASLGNGQDVFSASSSLGAPGLLVATDGTATGTSVLHDFGAYGVYDVTALGNGRAVFEGKDGSTGRELWVTNGTGPGTYLLQDINPGQPGSLDFASSQVTPPGNGMALFEAVDGTQGLTGEELWVTDGTSAGTTRLQTFTDNTAYVDDFTSIGGGEFLFESYDDSTHIRTVWRTDGSAAGTYVAAFSTPDDGNLTSANFSIMKDAANPAEALIAAGGDLWVTDGTSGGTSLVAQGANGHITYASVLDGETVFRVTNTARSPVRNSMRPAIGWTIRSVSATPARVIP